MDNIIYTFETANNILENHYIYYPSRNYDDENYKELRKGMSTLEFCYIMSLEECKRYEEGWRLFQKHFFSLWD